MSKWMLKACPICGGDLEWIEEEDGEPCREWRCMQAGHHFSQEEIDKAMAGFGTTRRLPPPKAAPPKQQETLNIDLEFLRKVYTPETVILLEVPLKPPFIDKHALHQYYADNRVRLIAEAFAYGEEETRNRWGIRDSSWTRQKHLWGLPINPSGGNLKRSIIHPNTKAPGEERVSRRVIVLGRVIKVLGALTRRDALWALYQAQHFIKANGPAGALPMDTIVTIVAGTFGLNLEQLKSIERSKEIDEARSVAMYILFNTGRFSTADIGRGLAGQHYSTVRYNINRVEQRLGLNSGQGLRRIIDEIQAQL
jgi:hypothetical protein